MPDEYISREAALTALQDSDLFNTTERQLRDIRELPAADVAEVVHGQWYMLDDCANAGLYCSACGRRVHHEEFAYKKLKSKYCPHCGARMDRGGERRMMNLKEIFKHYADDLGEGADIRIGGRHDRQTFEVPHR